MDEATISRISEMPQVRSVLRHDGRCWWVRIRHNTQGAVPMSFIDAVRAEIPKDMVVEVNGITHSWDINLFILPKEWADLEIRDDE